jgi:hypothetical protein
VLPNKARDWAEIGLGKEPIACAVLLSSWGLIIQFIIIVADTSRSVLVLLAVISSLTKS